MINYDEKMWKETHSINKKNEQHQTSYHLHGMVMKGTNITHFHSMKDFLEKLNKKIKKFYNFVVINY